MDNQAIRVLLIEDDPAEVELVRAWLRGANPAAFELDVSGRLSTGLDRLAVADCDVVLLDLNLPDSEGLETFQQAHARAPRVPIVVLTGRNDQDLAIRAVQQGAEDYVYKGWIDESSLVRSIHYAIERTRRRRAESALQAVSVKLQAAREIQQGLLPVAPPRLPGFDIAGFEFSADETGGDYYDFIPMPNNCLGIIVGDASGHGFGPALVIAETCAYLRAYTLTCPDVGEILTLLNRALMHGTQPEHFVTVMLAKLDPRRRSLVYASAGHPDGYVLSPTGSVRARLPSTGRPVGIIPDDTYSAGEPLTLEQGELVLLLSDGILEAELAGTGLFGVERALEVVQAQRREPAAVIVRALCDAVRDFCQNRPPHDDCTAVVLKVADGAT